MPVIGAIDEIKRSEEVVKIVCDLADTYDDTAIFLHVIPQEEYEKHRRVIADVVEFNNFTLNQEADSAERFAEQFVQENAEEIPSSIEYRGRVGDIATEILKETEEVEPRFLVISGRRRSPTGKALFGDRAQKILLNAECPVVTKLADL